jgi:hypothetical protein
MSELLKKILSVLPIIIPISIIFIVLVLLIRSSSNERYEVINANEYKMMPYRAYDGEDELTTCKRCQTPLSSIYNGYQTAPSPPAPYWPSRNNPDVISTASQFQNYSRMSSPLDDTKFEACDDAYRCNKYGVATGVQGRIF